MAQGYYTLSEAAQVLTMSVDELKQMAQKGKIRSFQDRGTLRFRTQDIQELARTRGISSDPELALGDASLSKPKPPASSSGKKRPTISGPKTPNKQEAAPDVFDFDVDGDNAVLGAAPKSGARSKPSSKGTRKAASPIPVAGADSDVRLVADGSDVTFSTPKEPPAKPPDSDVKVAFDPLKPKTNIHAGASGSRSKLAVDSGAQPKSKGSASSGSRHASPKPGSAPQPDSGVRLVPMDSDSDVKLLGASDEVALGGAGPRALSDSNVRLEKAALPPADSQDAMLLTEEINLDEEIAKQQERDKDKPTTKFKAKSELKLPAASPFELSDSDLDLPSELKASAGPKTPVKAEANQDSSDFDLAPLTGAKDEDSSDFDLGAAPAKDEGSSDFDLVPAADGSILLEGDSSDFSLEASDDGEPALQPGKGGFTRSSSGISLSNPVDAGISLEEKPDDDSGDFDLSLEPEATPKPQVSSPAEDSSDFELKLEKTPKPKKKPAQMESSDDIDLSLDVEDEAEAPAISGEDSEFEINLDASDDKSPSDSDSEFELTLDDSGNLEALDEKASAPQVKAKKGAAASSEEQDIFDTDFEVPALDESDDATVADSELESSDFDIALDDSDLAAEDESGSQVVALDEEEDAETAADDEEGAVADDVEVDEESSDFSDLDQDVEVEADADADADVEVDADEEEEAVASGKTRTVVKEKLIEPAPWGVMPIVFMLPCVIIMFLVGILGYELVQTSAGSRPPGPLTSAIAEMVGQPVSLKK